MDSEYALLALRLHIDMSPPHLNTRSNTAARRAACVFQVPPNDMWGNPEVATLTTVWVEELQEELPAVEIDDEEFEYGTHTWLLHLCHDCGHHECHKTRRTWFKATCFADEDFFEHDDYLVGIAYFEEFNQYVEPDALEVTLTNTMAPPHA